MGIDWKYQDKVFTSEDIGDCWGYVYLIHNLSNGKKYIGKKQFYFQKTKQVNGKKKKVLVPSDWNTYYGSNEALKKDVIEFGKENFHREILHLCMSKGECSYLEIKEQLARCVLESDAFYNTWIMCRIRNTHIKDYNARSHERIEKS
jgi:hypothetical protein